jgi:putative ABC transport system ATP-binding protein
MIPASLAPHATSATNAVECRALCKDFGDGDAKIRVLRDLVVSLRDSEMSLIVGPSGCGKTTLISIIAGLLKPTSGSVQVLGVPLSEMSDDALVEFRSLNLGFVFQQYNLLPALTAVENAAIPLIIQRVPRVEACRRARVLLEELGLGARLSAKPSQLSGGEQQRVAFARALVHDPKLLVCDEPTAALDAVAGQQVMQLLRAIAVKPGRTVIVVTHDSRVFDYGDTLVRVSDGQIERVESVRKARDLQATMNGSPA